LSVKDKNMVNTEGSVKASVILISSCKDDQLSSDSGGRGRNGLFTARLLQVWDQGKFTGDYRQFYAEIKRLLPLDQQPNYYLSGRPDPEFEKQKPFTI